jgi:mRNA interferase MazF
VRPICKVRLDKVRPAVILTRSVAAGFLTSITVAPITSTILGIATEVPVGPSHGLDHDSVISCDNIVTVHRHDVGDVVGYLHEADESKLLEAIAAAFDLEYTPSA